MALNQQDPLTLTDKKRAAWKYAGYKDFSRYLGYSRSFFFLRHFRTLNARVLLAMQDSIVELEEKLDKIDQDLSFKSRDNKNLNGTFRKIRGEQSETRYRIIWKLQRKLQKYSKNLFSLPP
jgi:hypothetical protein